ncbi:FAM72 protein-domain-containing protein [Syncephalis plumigaleata]|nr:FAM72 protein-domain-containing protein [Syncephalis plumigaleata]
MVQRRQPLCRRQLVLELHCRYCETLLTRHGDQTVLPDAPTHRLYISNVVPIGAAIYDTSLRHRRCGCIVQELTCQQCGNEVGWVLIVRCRRCERRAGSNAARRWIYPSEHVRSQARLNAERNDYLVWNRARTAQQGHGNESATEDNDVETDTSRHAQFDETTRIIGQPLYR